MAGIVNYVKLWLANEARQEYPVAAIVHIEDDDVPRIEVVSDLCVRGGLPHVVHPELMQRVPHQVGVVLIATVINKPFIHCFRVGRLTDHLLLTVCEDHGYASDQAAGVAECPFAACAEELVGPARVALFKEWKCSCHQGA